MSTTPAPTPAADPASGQAPGIAILPSMAVLADRYDAWLSDIWGVIHNGVSAFEAACDACVRFRARGGTVVLITNAPRPWDAVAAQLDRFGVPRAAYDAIVTSGDVTRAMLASQAGRSVFHLGPDRDRGVFEAAVGFSTPRFAPVEAADLVVNTGLFDDLTETPADYGVMLRGLAQRGVPMICANPDLMVERGDKLLYCAGALAQSYAAIGGRVLYAGKPHLPIYERAFDLIAKARGLAVGQRRILAIGDGLRTDMAGAEAAGLDAVFIPSLLHMPNLAHANGETVIASAEICALFDDGAFRPIAAQLGLRW